MYIITVIRELGWAICCILHYTTIHAALIRSILSSERAEGPDNSGQRGPRLAKPFVGGKLPDRTEFRPMFF